MFRKQTYGQLFSPGKGKVKDALRESQAIIKNSLVYTAEGYVLRNVLAEGYLPYEVFIKERKTKQIKIIHTKHKGISIQHISMYKCLNFLIYKYNVKFSYT